MTQLGAALKTRRILKEDHEVIQTHFTANSYYWALVLSLQPLHPNLPKKQGGGGNNCQLLKVLSEY